jgi:hypothetical protein
MSTVTGRPVKVFPRIQSDQKELSPTAVSTQYDTSGMMMSGK